MKRKRLETTPESPNPVPIGFRDEVLRHLERVGWSQADLCRHTGIFKSQMSAWIGTPKRRIGRDDVGRIAWAIAGAYDGVLSDQSREPVDELLGRGSIDKLISRLLRAAGYSPLAEYRNHIWESHFARPQSLDLIEREKLDRERPVRVGWLPWPPLTTKTFDGPIESIVRRTCAYLGRQGVLFVHAEVPDLINMLTARQIDFIAPLWIQVPWRQAADVKPSNPLPKRAVGFGCLVNQISVAEIEMVLNADECPQPRLEILTTTSGSASTHHKLLFPSTQFTTRQVNGVEEAVQFLIHEPHNKQTEAVRCYVADTVVCNHQYQLNEGKIVILDKALYVKSEGGFADRFPIGFAVHPDEPELLDAINRCVDILHLNSFLDIILSGSGLDLA